MKKWTLLPLLLTATMALAQGGYEIKVTVKPFRNQYVYLGHYSGKQFPIIDSVKLDQNGHGVFKGSKALGGGIYVVAYPSRNNFFEILVDKNQRFSVSADTLNTLNRTFTNSPENENFVRYQREMMHFGKTIDSANRALRVVTTAADSATLTARMRQASAGISAHRKQVIAKNPNTLLSTLMHLMEEPSIPPAEKHPGGKYDSAYAYRYFKSHYWDGINFWDDRVTRTPGTLFDERLDKYYNTLVVPHPDSVIHELNWMLGYATPSKEMTRFLLVKFITRYLNQKYMWEDKVFLHLFEKYFATRDYDWLTPQGKTMITERAYNLMANVMGNQAENIALPDVKGETAMLYADTSRFTVVCFWDPTCGHCKEVLPALDSMYRTKWKTSGVSMFAVARETEGNKELWQEFIRQHHLENWTHVYYSKAEEKARVDNNIAGYTQLYDAQTVPAIYLLDKEKRIVAKKLTWQQTDEVLQVKLRTP